MIDIPIQCDVCKSVYAVADSCIGRTISCQVCKKNLVVTDDAKIPDVSSELEKVLQYHRETKHHFNKFARSLGYMDWNSQPQSFRYYMDTPAMVLELDTQSTYEKIPYDFLYQRQNFPSQQVGIKSIANLLRYSLAISAWKGYKSDRWALRVNPSSGNLHPTECYLLLGAHADFATHAGIYHYVAKNHNLERRCMFSQDLWTEIMGDQHCFLIALTSIIWREAWKYGERAFRYCQHDIGHALAAVRLSAAMLGWQMQVLAWPFSKLDALLGLDRHAEFVSQEYEEPALIAMVSPEKTKSIDSPSVDVINAIKASQWFGKANQLSSRHVRWHRIDKVAIATRLSNEMTFQPVPWSLSPEPVQIRDVEAHDLILQRRSAQSYDGNSYLARQAFFTILARTLPADSPPWDCLYWKPCIHLVLFVHRVEELDTGIYMLVRDPEALSHLKSAMQPDFIWKRVSKSLPLFLLMHGEYSELAITLSCGQDIAGDGCFTLGMITRFSQSLNEQGAWFYRNLFWESGMIGQVLYLEAEAAGVRGTGIGCFYDDRVHEILGLKDHRFQSLYHFTIGMPVEDQRILTLSAYPTKD